MKGYYTIERNGHTIEKNGTEFPAIFTIIVGIIFIIIGVAMLNSSNSFKKNALTTHATLYYEKDSYKSAQDDSKRDVYNVYAEYNVNGVRYYEYVYDTSSGSGTHLSIGSFNFFKSNRDKEATIYYNPDNPKEIQIKSTNFGFYIFIILGILAIIAGVVSIVKDHTKIESDTNQNEKESLINTNYIAENHPELSEKMAKIREKVNNISIGLTDIIMLLVGTIIIVAAISMMFSESAFGRKAIETTALVSKVDVQKKHNDDNVMYTEVQTYLQYEVQGQQYEKVLTSETQDYEKGENIKIYYDPDNPKDISTTNKTDYLIHIFAVSVGLIFIGGAFLSAGRKTTNKNRYNQQKIY